jgi:hypothetical protein
MSRAGARMKLRDLLAPIAERVEREVDLPDLRDGLLLLQVVEGRSFELASALVVEAGLELTSDFEEIFLDEEPDG